MPAPLNPRSRSGFSNDRGGRGDPLEFAVGKGQVIAGWDEGILTMRVGGKRCLGVPEMGEES